MRLELGVLLVASFLVSRSACAQMVGIGSLLNPEGSRLFPQSILLPRHPGKPDPRWRSFDWRYVSDVADSAKYRLYFYEQEDWTARFVIPKIRAQMLDLARTFSYAPTREFSYLLFTTQREFRQANIFEISEGVQGITSTEEATMAIPYWGEAQTFDHISKHELVHQFQVQKLSDLGADYARERMVLIPLWFVEGMAEYYSLKGLDPESRVYLRDMVLNSDPDKDYRAPKFFEEAPLSFLTVYKAGQAKIDFLEKRFGAGTVQRLLRTAGTSLGTSVKTFRELVAHEVALDADKIETEWQAYLAKFKEEADALPVPSPSATPITEAGDTLDLFQISPNGEIMAYRQVDPLTGVSSYQLMDLGNPEQKTQLIEEGHADALSLYFMLSPTLAITDDRVSYAVETSNGPEVEYRDFKKGPNGKLEVGEPSRLFLHSLGFLQITSLALSPEGKSLAVVGVTAKGDANIGVIDDITARPLVLRQITNEHYSWRNLSWDRAGLLGASDRTANGKYAIFRIHPANGFLEQLTFSSENHLTPSVAPGGVLYQSWETEIPQAFLRVGKKQEQVTAVKTGAFFPLIRNYRSEPNLYDLRFQGGRYRLFRGRLGNYGESDPQKLDFHDPWTPLLESLPQTRIEKYKPFSSGGKRIDNLSAFFASGGFFGVGGTLSDLMRDYAVSADLVVLGRLSRSSASAFLSSQRGRSTWTLGAYRTVQPRLDTIFPPDSGIRTYLHQEYGALGALQYPFGAFSFVDVELRLGAVNRTEYSDPNLSAAWEAVNPGSEMIIAPTLRLGFDDILYELYSGPLKGSTLMLEFDTGYFPGRGSVAERLRLDVSRYYHLPGRTVLAFQGIASGAFGDPYRPSFLLSSDDILRAYPFADDRLYGNYLLAGKTELRFPVGSLFGFAPLRGVVAYDLGSVFNDGDAIDSKLASSYSGGISLNIPPLAINFLLAYPITTAPGPRDSSVAHFTLRYLYM